MLTPKVLILQHLFKMLLMAVAMQATILTVYQVILQLQLPLP